MMDGLSRVCLTDGCTGRRSDKSPNMSDSTRRRFLAALRLVSLRRDASSHTKEFRAVPTSPTFTSPIRWTQQNQFELPVSHQFPQRSQRNAQARTRTSEHGDSVLSRLTSSLSSVNVPTRTENKRGAASWSNLLLSMSTLMVRRRPWPLSADVRRGAGPPTLLTAVHEPASPPPPPPSLSLPLIYTPPPISSQKRQKGGDSGS